MGSGVCKKVGMWVNVISDYAAFAAKELSVNRTVHSDYASGWELECAHVAS